MSRDGSNERMKTTKGDVKYQKEMSHCLEENRYVMPRKIQIDKLPDHVKDLLRVQDQSLESDVQVAATNVMHESYMENLKQIREQIEIQKKEAIERQRQIQQMMSFKQKNKAAAPSANDNKGSNETLDKQGREQNASNLSQAPGEDNNENTGEEVVALSDNDDRNQVRSVSPEVDQQKLEKFDHSRQKISTLLVNDKHEVSLEDCSKPVREVIKVNYGVSYNESL